MACVPVFFQPSGSAAQLTYGLMVCFMAFGAYVQFDPYEDRGNDAVAKLCQMQIFFSLLGSVALTSVSSEQEAGSNMDVLLVVLYLVPVQPPCRPSRPALHSPLLASWICAQVGLAMFLESPLLELAKKQLGRLREQQEKIKASSGQMVKAAFKANAAQSLKSRGDASKKESKVTFTDLAQELPPRDSEAGPSVHPEGP